MAIFRLLEKRDEVINKDVTKTSYSKVIKAFGYDFLETSFESQTTNTTPAEPIVGFVGNPPLKISYDD